MPDIDIDFADRTRVLDVIKHVPAAIDSSKKHNTGVYCHTIPQDPLTGLSSIEYKEAEDRGVRGNNITPFLLERIRELTGGSSLETNIALIKNNAKIGSQIACQLVLHS